MKKVLLLSSFFMLALFLSAPQAQAQGTTRGPEQSAVRDPEMEKDSLHNLEVAWQYFKLKKAYLASLKRCEEIIAGNPNFSKIDEVYYIAGVSSLRLSEGKGKQKQLPAETNADKLRDDAREYLSQVFYNFPDSKYRKEAEKELRALGGPKAKDALQPTGD
ncbi:MAG TPA: outer membrane protein assembly factor BamD [Pyrinomonadaceae bacterium]|nr:outer membrane protein assembly factor BamD [Pyrinomonadaceae bacterium]